MKSTMTAVGLLGFAAIVSSASQPLISAEPNPKTLLQQARNELRGQHLAEAAATYEKVIADTSKDAPKYKPDALYEMLLLRVSPNPAVHDLQRGAAAIQELRAYPQYPKAQEITAIGALLEEINHAADEKKAGDKRLADVTANLAAANANLAAANAKTQSLEAELTTARQSDETGKLKQEGVGLRAENKTLRDETKSLRDQLTRAQAEIQKRDEALKRVAGSLIKSR